MHGRQDLHSIITNDGRGANRGKVIQGKIKLSAISSQPERALEQRDPPGVVVEPLIERCEVLGQREGVLEAEHHGGDGGEQGLFCG